MLIFFIRRLTIIQIVLGFTELTPAIRTIVFYWVNAGPAYYYFGNKVLLTKKE